MVTIPKNPTVDDFLKSQSPDRVKAENQEYSDTGWYSKPFMNDYQAFKNVNQPISGATGSSTGIKIEPTIPKLWEELSIPSTIGKSPVTWTNTNLSNLWKKVSNNTWAWAGSMAVWIIPWTTGTTGTTPTWVTGTDTTGATTGFNTWDKILDTELTDIQKDKNKALEETKKGFLLWKSDFEKNKQYYTNFDTVNNLYTWVVNELTAWMDNNWVIPDSLYQQVANKYGLTLDEVKNPQSIFKKWELTAEWKEKLWVTAFESGIDKQTTDFERRKADIQTNLDKTIENLNFQIDDVGQQLARNIGWTEAQGAWSGALRGSWYMQGIENIRKDWETTINRLKTLAQQATTASEEDISRLTEDFNLWIAEAKKEMNTQLDDIKKNSILALSEAQTVYWLWSDKLSKTLDKINQEYWIKSNQAVSAYLSNLKSMNDLATQNMNLIEKSNQLEEAKANKRYEDYLSNNGAILQNTSLTQLAQDVWNGTISLQRANDLKQIMLTSIQSTLGKLAPLTTQELKTVETLMNQGFTPSQIVAEMMTLDKFQQQVKVDEPKVVKIWADEYGNDVYGSYNPNTKQFEPIRVWGWSQVSQKNQFNWDYSTLDFSKNPELLQQAGVKLEASIKNNNPTWMTWGISPELKWMFDEAGIKYEIWTARPKDEWGNYIKFASVQDGLNAYNIALTQRWDDVFERLKKWVWTSNDANNTKYANSLMSAAWITKWEKFSELSQGQLSALMDAQLQRESPTFYKALSNLQSQATQQDTIQPIEWEYSFEQQAIIDNYLKNPASKDSINALKRAWLTSQDIQSYKESYELSPDDNANLSGILKNISGTAVNAEEYARWKKSYKEWRKEWRSEQDIQDRIAWYYVFDNNKWDKTIEWTLKGLKKYAYWVNENLPQEVARQINLKDYSWALQTLENAKFEKAKLENPQANASQVLDKYMKLENYIKKYNADFWPLSGRLSTTYNKYLVWDEEYQKMLWDLKLYIAEYRNQISGSAITASEWEFLDDVIATINDKPENALWKIKAVKENVINSYNAYRQQAWLPKLNDSEIRNVNSRLNKYTGQQLFQTSTWTSQSNTIKSPSWKTYTY